MSFTLVERLLHSLLKQTKTWPSPGPPVRVWKRSSACLQCVLTARQATGWGVTALLVGTEPGVWGATSSPLSRVLPDQRCPKTLVKVS